MFLKDYLSLVVSFAVCNGLKLPFSNRVGLRPFIFPPFNLGSVSRVFVDFVVSEIKVAKAVT